MVIGQEFFIDLEEISYRCFPDASTKRCKVHSSKAKASKQCNVAEKTICRGSFLCLTLENGYLLVSGCKNRAQGTRLSTFLYVCSFLQIWIISLKLKMYEQPRRQAQAWLYIRCCGVTLRKLSIRWASWSQSSSELIPAVLCFQGIQLKRKKSETVSVMATPYNKWLLQFA